MAHASVGVEKNGHAVVATLSCLFAVVACRLLWRERAGVVLVSYVLAISQSAIFHLAIFIKAISQSAIFHFVIFHFVIFHFGIFYSRREGGGVRGNTGRRIFPAPTPLPGAAFLAVAIKVEGCTSRPAEGAGVGVLPGNVHYGKC